MVAGMLLRGLEACNLVLNTPVRACKKAKSELSRWTMARPCMCTRTCIYFGHVFSIYCYQCTPLPLPKKPLTNKSDYYELMYGNKVPGL